MALLPVEIVFGLYLGLVAGVVPTLLSGLVAFGFRYLTGVTVPGFGVATLAVAVAGINGGLLGLLDPSVSRSPRLVVALLVVLMLSFYAHSQGDRLGATLPRRAPFRSLGRRTLSADVIEMVEGQGKVTIRPTGAVGDVEGYPPLPADLRARIGAGRWEFPADLPVGELERRLAERLRADHDLADVQVSIDERGRATVAAAPPAGGLSRRVPPGRRAVSVPALLPTGIARNDVVSVPTAGGRVEGPVLGAATTDAAPVPTTGSDPDPDPTDGDAATPPTAPTTTGGEGRLTLAVRPGEVAPTLAGGAGGVRVLSRGVRREFELLGLLRRTGRRVRRLTVAADDPLSGRSVGALRDDDAGPVTVLGLRRRAGDETGGGWRVAPEPGLALAAGDELFVAGTRQALDRLRPTGST